MNTRFFPAALTTGMASSSIDPDLAASLKARDRHADRAARTGRRSVPGFSTLVLERSQPAEPAEPSAWRGLRRILKHLSAS